MKSTIYLFVLILSTICFDSTLQAQNNITTKINELTQNYEAAGYHGSVLVGKGNSIISKSSFGIANQNTKKKITPETLFKTESTGKMFTSVGVLQLVQTGKLDLQKTISDYLPQTKIKNASKITLHHLLTHQSGLTSPWEAPNFVFKNYTKQEWWEIIETNPLAFDEPGKGVYYSNSAFEILAAIIEKVTGMEFKEYCAKKIFKPAGMKRTYYEIDSIQFLKLGAKPYQWLGTKTYYEYPVDHLKGGGAGGWISCVEDFYLFGTALLNGKLISKKYFEIMMTGYIDMPPGKYGYALEIYKDIMVPGKTTYGHNGGGMGYSCDLFFEPDSKIIVVTMMNMYSNSRYVTGNYMRTVFGSEPQKPEVDKRMIFFDLMEKNGLDDFNINYQGYLNSIGMKKPNPFFLISIADGFDLIGQTENLKKYLNTLMKIIPENPVLYIRLGDLEIKQKQNENARSYYLKAKELSEKNDPMWLGEINSKLKSL